jgi:hypothetical protein
MRKWFRKYETVVQEVLQQLIYRNSWRLFLNMSLRSASFIDKAFFYQKAKAPVFGLFSSSVK